MDRITIRLAFRNILRNKRRTGLMVLLVSSGLAALILTDGLATGMIDLMIRKVTDTWLGEAQLHAPEFRETFDGVHYLKDPSSLTAILDAELGVRTYTARTMSGGMVASSNNVTPAAIIGVEPGREANVSRLKEALIEGQYLSDDNPSDILIGYKMAELLEVRLGDRIVTTSSEVEGGELSQALFRVSGILKFNDRLLDKEMAYISLAAGQKISGIGDGVHEIAIRFHADANEQEVLDRLSQKFTTEEVEFLGWRELMPDLASVLSVNSFSTLIVGGILFTLVSLGLINSMFMSIYERHYEFGVMLGLGTRRRLLFSLVCWEGAFIGLFGAIIGSVIGGAIVYWLSQTGISFGEAEMSGIMLNEPIKTIARAQQFILFPVFVVILAGLACIIPAIHGARLTPSDALRRAI